MLGMRYPIDVAFLDDDLRVLETIDALAPGRLSPRVARATSVLELPAGRLATLGVASGARLSIEPDPKSGVVTDRIGRTRGTRSPAIRAAAWVIGFLLMTALGVSFAAREISPDAVCPSYICFWSAGKLIASGQSPYDPVLQAQIQQQYGWSKTHNGLGFWDFLPYFYPPSILTPFCVAFVPLGYRTARLAWLVVNLELFVLSGYLLRRSFANIKPWIPVVLVPIFALSLFSAIVGQVTALVLFLVAVTWRLLESRWDRSTGWILAWMMVKPQLTILFVPAVLLWASRQKRWRVWEGFTAGLVVLLAVSTVLAPSWPIQFWRQLHDLPQPTTARPAAGATWLLLLRVLGLHDGVLWLAYLVAVVPIVVSLCRSALDRFAPLDHVVALSMLGAFFIAPYARAYDFPLLLIPLFALLGSGLSPVVRATLGIAFVILPFFHLGYIASASPGGVNFMPQVALFWMPLVLAAAWAMRTREPVSKSENWSSAFHPLPSRR